MRIFFLGPLGMFCFDCQGVKSTSSVYPRIANKLTKAFPVTESMSVGAGLIAGNRNLSSPSLFNEVRSLKKGVGVYLHTATVTVSKVILEI